MHDPSTRSISESLSPDSSVREAVLEAATARLDKAFGDRVQVKVERYNRVGPWVFVQGSMHSTDSDRPYYVGSAYEARRADGAMSDVYAVLLKKADDAGPDNDARSWRLSDYAIGPTDVAWLTWPDEHEAPRALFGF